VRSKLKPVLRVLSILTGSLLSAIAVNELLVPHLLLSGGVGGIALIVQYLSGIPSGALILVINIPIFITGIREIDRDFILYSLIGTVSLSVFLIILRNIEALRFIRVDDTMLAGIFGGVLNGIGSGIVFRNRGSMGGSDIIAVIIKKKRSINIGTVLFSINLVIILAASALYGVKPAMFTLISMYISSMVLDRVQEGFNRKKSVFIVSEKEDEVAEAILKSLNRGVTFLNGEGAYTKSNRRIIYCVVTTTQLAQLKHIVEAVDSNAFLTVSDTAEVLGKGFRNTGI
jgi:Uncharacterized conserved protein